MDKPAHFNEYLDNKVNEPVGENLAKVAVTVITTPILAWGTYVLGRITYNDPEVLVKIVSGIGTGAFAFATIYSAASLLSNASLSIGKIYNRISRRRRNDQHYST